MYQQSHLKFNLLFLFIFSFTIAQSQGDFKVFQTNQLESNLSSVNYDGADFLVIADNQNAPRRVSVDSDKKEVYWIEGGSGTIWKSNFDGSNKVAVISNESTNLAIVEFDLINQRLLFNVTGEGTIKSANLDGSNVQTLITGIEQTTGYYYDPSNDHLYWTEFNLGTIHRSDGNGENIVTLFETNTKPFDISYDCKNDKIYWSDRDTEKIHRANTDGTDQEDVIVANGNKGSIALDMKNEKIYWTNISPNQINSSNLDGTATEILASSNDPFAGLDIYLPLDISNCDFLISVNDKFDQNIDALQVFPNPVYDNFSYTLQSNYIGEVEVTLFNIEGKKIYNEKTFKQNEETWTKDINVRQEESGILFLRVQYADKIITQRIIHIYKPLIP